MAYDQPSGTWIFVCMHSTALGPAAGGTRMKVYDTPADGLADGMRLSAGMTSKFAVTDLEFGGGKAVLAVPAIPQGGERRRLLLKYADIIESLNGGFYTAPDVNTSAADMDVIAERCSYVFSRSAENGGSGNPGPFTARGVYHGIRASCAHAFGSDDLTGRSVLVQGVGSVGAALADLLAADGATLLLSDVDELLVGEARRATLRERRRARRCNRDRVRRLRAVCTRSDSERRHDSAPARSDRRRVGEQPARGGRGRRTTARRRCLVRPGLRHQRRRRPLCGSTRVARMGRRSGRDSAGRHRRNPHAHLRARGRRRDDDTCGCKRARRRPSQAFAICGSLTLSVASSVARTSSLIQSACCNRSACDAGSVTRMRSVSASPASLRIELS